MTIKSLFHFKTHESIMLFPTVQIFFAKTIQLTEIYQFFEKMQEISPLKFCCLDLDSFCHLSQEIFAFIENKDYHFIGIYWAENAFPTFEIHQPLFESDEFQSAFTACLKMYYPNLTYYQIDRTVVYHRLIEFNGDGMTGNMISLE